MPYRELINPDLGTIKCSKCERDLPREKMKTRNGNPTRMCRMCSKLEERYRLTYVEYSEMQKEQRGKCAICLKNIYESSNASTRIVVDHCHKSGKVRGLLCTSCNAGLGSLKKRVTSDRVEQYLSRSVQIPLDKCVCVNCKDTRRSTGITCTQIEYLVGLDNGSCQICLEKFEGTPHIDHDHSCCGKRRKYSCFSCIRGVLCVNCNLMLGQFKDSSANVGRALSYLGVDEK